MQRPTKNLASPVPASHTKVISCNFPDVQRFLACGVVGHVSNPFEILVFIIIFQVKIATVFGDMPLCPILKQTRGGHPRRQPGLFSLAELRDTRNVTNQTGLRTSELSLPCHKFNIHIPSHTYGKSTCLYNRYITMLSQNFRFLWMQRLTTLEFAGESSIFGRSPSPSL